MINTLKKYSFLFIIVISGACGSSPFDVDVSAIDIDLEVKRLDKEMFKKPVNEVIKNIPEMRREYGRFFELYTTRIVPLGGRDSSLLPAEMKNYLSYPTTKELADKVFRKFDDFTPYEKQIEDGFRHYKYYFREAKIPVIYTCISSLNYQVVTDNNLIGIGLDLYLGEENEIYTQNPNFHQYLFYRFNSSRIAFDCLDAWINMKFAYNDSIDNVINNMIYSGRQKYFLHAIFPEANAHEILGYTEEQWEWCEQSEHLMWSTMVEKKLLFSTETLDISKFVSEAPYTKYFPKSSPGRAGVWIGYRIVEQYMKNNATLTLPELMKETDYQKILNSATYNP